jgi:hypothetical protein
MKAGLTYGVVAMMAVLALTAGARLSPFSFAWPHAMILLAVWAAVPMGIGLAQPVLATVGGGRGWWAYKAGAVAVTGVLLAEPFGYSLGEAGPALAGVWLGAMLSFGWRFGWPFGQRLRRGERPALWEWLVMAGVAQVSVGAAWLVADAAGWPVFGFDLAIVRLTAAHFHFAGFSLPILVGLALREYGADAWWARGSGLVVLAGVPLVALGITLTRLGVNVKVEAALGAIFGLGALGVAVMQGRLAWRWWKNGARGAGGWLGFSAMAFGVGMSLAIAYALRPWFPWPLLTLPWMWAVHGTVQVLGFTMGGLMAWALRGRA